MKFSIIVPTANRNSFLQNCLEKLDYNAQELSKEDYEVIVTDDGKENQAKELIKERFPWIYWVEGPKRGPAANRNNGAKYAQGEWLIFLDDDVLPDENILNNYKQGIEQTPDVLAFEGAIIPDDWDLLKRDMAECPVNTKGGCFWSANICIQKKLFNEIGGFDEQFSIAAQEDQDIYIRLKELTKVSFIDQAIVVHPVRIISLKNKIRSFPAQAKNWIRYIKKHEPKDFKQKLILSLYTQFQLAIVSLIKFKIKKSIFHSYAFFYGMQLLVNRKNY